MIATRTFLPARRRGPFGVVFRTEVFLAGDICTPLYVLRSARATCATRWMAVIVDSSATTATAAAKCEREPVTAHAAPPRMISARRASRGANPTLAVRPSDSAFARMYGTI